MDFSSEKIIPMSGIPFNAANIYLKKLIELDESVSIYDQIQKLEYRKKLLKCKVVCILFLTSDR